MWKGIIYAKQVFSDWALILLLFLRFLTSRAKREYSLISTWLSLAMLQSEDTWKPGQTSERAFKQNERYNKKTNILVATIPETENGAEKKIFDGILNE